MEPLQSAIAKLKAGQGIGNLTPAEMEAVQKAKDNQELTALIAGKAEAYAPVDALVSKKVKTLPEVEVVEDRPSWWQRNGKKTILGAAAVIGATAGGILIASGLGAPVGAALTGISTKALIGLGIAGLAATAASCKKETEVVARGPIQTQVVNIDDLINRIDQRLANIENLLGQQINLLKDMKALLQQIKNNGDITNDKLDAIVALCASIEALITNMGNDLADKFDQLINRFTQFSVDALTALNTIINNQNLDRQQNRQFMQAILDKLNQMEQADADRFVQFMVKVDQLIHNQEIGENQRNTIIALLQNASRDNANLIAQVIARLDDIINNQHLQGDKLDQLISLSTQILAKIPDNANEQDYMPILTQILNKLTSIDTNLANGIQSIIANQTTLNANMLAGLQALMDNDDANTAAIIAALDAHTAEMVLQFNGVKAIMRTMVANQGTIITNQNDIKDLLTNNIGPLLTAIYNKIPEGGSGSGSNVDLTPVITALNSLAQALGVVIQNQNDARTILQAILAAIPDGCNCVHNEIDLSVVINLLQQILQQLGAGSNEGVDSDDITDELSK